MTRENTELAGAAQRLLAYVEARKATFNREDMKLVADFALSAPLHEGEGEPEEPPTCLAWFVGLARKHGLHNQADWLRAYMDARAAPPPSVEVFGASAEGADTHRDADGAVLVRLSARAAELVNSLCVDRGLELSDDLGCRAQEGGGGASENERMLGCYLSEVQSAIKAAVSTAEQVGTSVASEPNPSVEVERLREALRFYLLGDDDGSVARAALSKQEPGVPTPGGDDEAALCGTCPDGVPAILPPEGWTCPECDAEWGDEDDDRIVPTPGGEGK